MLEAGLFAVSTGGRSRRDLYRIVDGRTALIGFAAAAAVLAALLFWLTRL
jgi:hypothetical protein